MRVALRHADDSRTALLSPLRSSSSTSHAQVGSQPGSGFTTVLSSAMRYAMNYEQQLRAARGRRDLRAGAAAAAEPRRQPEPAQPRRRHAGRRPDEPA